MYRGNLQNTGVYDTRAARYFDEEPNWAFNAPSQISCDPVVSEGVVYFGTHKGDLFAVDALSGIERWRFRMRLPVMQPPEIVGGVVYCVSFRSHLFALDAQSGARVSLKGDLAGFQKASPPAVLGEVMYMSADSGHHAVDLTTGRIIRSFPSQRFAKRRPVVGGETLTFGSPTEIAIMDLESGICRKRWYDDSFFLLHEICFHNDSYFCFLWMGFLRADHPETLPRTLMVLAPKFDRNYSELPLDSRTAPAADNGILYFGGDSGLYAIDIQTMTVKWEFWTGAPIGCSPSIAEDLIYFGCQDGTLYVLNKNTGQLVHSLATATGLPVRTSPALWNGKVYFADTGGKLYSWGSVAN
jgi:eukaryotic-like serine/threonine-protein kinase